MDINDIINPIQSQSMCISEYNVESICGVLLATTILTPCHYHSRTKNVQKGCDGHSYTTAIAGYNIDRLITLTQRGSLQWYCKLDWPGLS